MHIHNNLKLLRTYRKATQDIVANALDVKRSTLSGWENGQSEPNCLNLLKLGSYYRLSLDIIIGTDLTLMRPSQIEELQRGY